MDETALREFEASTDMPDESVFNMTVSVGDMRKFIAAVQERDRLRALLWVSWFELNTIRARDGAQQHIGWNRGQPFSSDGVDPKYFGAIVDALDEELGEDTVPWPADYMKPHLVAANLRKE